MEMADSVRDKYRTHTTSGASAGREDSLQANRRENPFAQLTKEQLQRLQLLVMACLPYSSPKRL